MSDSPRYTEFGFPLLNIPRPDARLTQLALVDTLVPLLEGTRVMLNALASSLSTDNVGHKEAPEALYLLGGHLATAVYLLNRWDKEQRGEYDDD